MLYGPEERSFGPYSYPPRKISITKQNLETFPPLTDCILSDVRFIRLANCKIGDRVLFRGPTCAIFVENPKTMKRRVFVTGGAHGIGKESSKPLPDKEMKWSSATSIPSSALKPQPKPEPGSVSWMLPMPSVSKDAYGNFSRRGATSTSW